MPIYEYEVEGGCRLCGGRFELRRHRRQSPLTHCPLCKKPVCKVISCVHTPKITRQKTIQKATEAGFTVLERRHDGSYQTRKS
jgi:putative FmdB family regulatory protein